MREASFTKAIAVVAVSFVVTHLSTFAWLAVTLKSVGYMDGNPMGYEFSWSAVFLRERGLLFLLLPAVWTLYAIKSQRAEHGIFTERIAIIVGFTMTLLIAVWYTHTALNPITRWPLSIPVG